MKYKFLIKAVLNVIILIFITFLFTFLISRCLPEICLDNSGWDSENTPNANFSEIELELVTLINEYRLENTKIELIKNTALAVSSQRHVNDMLNRGYFNEVTRDCGWDFHDRAQSSGIEADAEIIYRGSSDPNNIIEIWKDGSENTKLLEGEFTSIGIGEKNGIWVVLFKK